ncbi:MAG: glycosyltransferase family 4 protein [Candidatus Hydrogenedentes bacterium]|nr:glycosyltransferase family 4 protein [Candidatus Hydrogenedentota bacterium]
MRRIRVAHVITRMCKGGAQENTFHTVRLANRERFEVDLISGYTAPGEPSMEDAVRAAGIEIVRVASLVRNPSPLRDLRAYGELTRIFAQRKYDIVHTHTSKAGYLGRIAAAKARVPIIVHTPHGHVFFGYFNAALTALYTMLERNVARKSDRLIELTRRGVEQHLAEGVGTAEQWTSIFSGIDLAPFTAAIEHRDATRTKLGIGRDDFVVGGVGRLEPVKGFSYFVQAAHIVAESLPNARFVLAGDGAERKSLESEAKSLGLRIQFLGIRDDVSELMAAMDVCVVPSLNEGMGRVILEAGAAGTPVVATNVGGIPEVLIETKTGLLVRPRDETGIASAVLSLAADPAQRERLGGAAREHAQQFSIARMVEQIESLYETLIREKRLDA